MVSFCFISITSGLSVSIKLISVSIIPINRFTVPFSSSSISSCNSYKSLIVPSKQNSIFSNSLSFTFFPSFPILSGNSISHKSISDPFFIIFCISSISSCSSSSKSLYSSGFCKYFSYLLCILFNVIALLASSLLLLFISGIYPLCACTHSTISFNSSKSSFCVYVFIVFCKSTFSKLFGKSITSGLSSSFTGFCGSIPYIALPSCCNNNIFEFSSSALVHIIPSIPFT